ncbi:endoglucanase 15-like [Pyrus ussuriensis x Pyrus communis]|uniref:Endoglucanase n=1 Tax=Pyrus ussuriensis x Pyrus communis TaxID=2448454 RepID=A0A5N5H8M9_9ROSA|nr:endoglucanase 15-like [Pyrus ussuriensis x Pyrus communis]
MDRTGRVFGLVGCLLLVMLHGIACQVDYHAALTKSLLYFEGQRSGKLPDNNKLQRVQWRGDSALKDGADAGIDLVGGYYDAGDNLKLGFPMAFTITMLSWSQIEMGNQLKAKQELTNVLHAIKWGTDYLIKAHPKPEVLYAQIGEPDSDHGCWQRPEDMATPRTAFKIDDQHPGSDLAAETAAAFAAASIAFKNSDYQYSSKLLTHAKQLFDFACNHPGLYQGSIPSAGKVYPSSGYHDELLWAAAWLHRATNEKRYLDHVEQAEDVGGTRSEFSWDDKYVGAQILIARLVLEGKVENGGKWAACKSHAEEFICSCIQKGNTKVPQTPGGLLWFSSWDNIQYVATATFATIVYSNYLATKYGSLNCAAGNANPSDLIAFVKSQVDYILGSNPNNMSYMVGYGGNYPQRIHHRGASIISIKKDSTPVTCKGGYADWFNREAANPNVLDGAVVSPNENDGFSDERSNFQHGEPTTYNNGPLVGYNKNNFFSKHSNTKPVFHHLALRLSWI